MSAFSGIFLIVFKERLLGHIWILVKGLVEKTTSPGYQTKVSKVSLHAVLAIYFVRLE